MSSLGTVDVGSLGTRGIGSLGDGGDSVSLAELEVGTNDALGECVNDLDHFVVIF